MSAKYNYVSGNCISSKNNNSRKKEEIICNANDKGKEINEQINEV